MYNRNNLSKNPKQLLAVSGELILRVNIINGHPVQILYVCNR